MIYEIYYEKQDGTVVYCQDTDCELYAIEEIRKLAVELIKDNFEYNKEELLELVEEEIE